jgi:hypothetical protein
MSPSEPETVEAEVVVICPRECSSPKTMHCLGLLKGGRARCFHCGRWMPLDEALDFDPWWDDTEPVSASGGAE